MRHNYSGDQGDYTKYALLNQLARDGQLITGINWYLTEHHEAMTDAAPEPGEEKPPWRERKEAYVAHLAGEKPAEAAVTISISSEMRVE